MAASRTWPHKPKMAPPPHYYEGFLEKKSPQDKDYKKFWAGIKGLKLYFYNSNRDLQYAEKIDLTGFVSLSDEDSPRTVGNSSREWPRLSLKLQSQEVKLKVESLESREMWKGFILTMVEMKIPSTLTLLPGHIYMLSEALEKEKEERAKLELPDLWGDKQLPSCFFRVSRTEAEVVLEKYESCGNMLLRPGGDGKSVAVTTRQKANETATVKHYKISIVGGEYIINIEEPYRCSSLTGVLDFFVHSSRGILVPLCLDESYAVSLEILETDRESGESILMPSKIPGISPCNSKGIPEEKKAFLIPSCPLPLPRAIPVQPTFPASAVGSQNIYEEEDPPDRTYMNDEQVAEMRQAKSPRGPVCVLGASGQKPAFKGPPMLPRKPSSGLETKETSESIPPRKPRSFSIGMCEELERKLRERRATLQD